MALFNTMVGGFAGLVGFALTYTALDFTETAKPPGIEVSGIQIYADGRTFYDRDTTDGQWLAWSGQIFSEDGQTLICRGGGTSQYFQDTNPLDTKDVGWLVDPKCTGNLSPGQLFVFTWVPLDSDYASVRFPSEGYGVVKTPNSED